MFSHQHSSLVAKNRNLSTEFILPQFHLVFHDRFETVVGDGSDDNVMETISNNLFETNCDWYIEDEYDADRKLVYKAPPLNEVWLTEPKQHDRKE